MMIMKWNLKPWQIGMICAAGVVVIGGAGTGIWYGVTHAGNTAEEDTTPSVIESVQDAEPALDSTELASAVEMERESETEVNRDSDSQPQKQKETKDDSSQETESTPTIPPKADKEDEITFEYDPILSREVTLLVQKMYPNRIPDESLCDPNLHPENFIYGQQVSDSNSVWSYRGKPESLTAEGIVNAWTNMDLSTHPTTEQYYPEFFIQIIRYTNGYVWAVPCGRFG